MTYQKMIVFPLFLSFFRALTALASLHQITINHIILPKWWFDGEFILETNPSTWVIKSLDRHLYDWVCQFQISSSLGFEIHETYPYYESTKVYVVRGADPNFWRLSRTRQVASSLTLGEKGMVSWLSFWIHCTSKTHLEVNFFQLKKHIQKKHPIHPKSIPLQGCRFGPESKPNPGNQYLDP